MDYTNESAPATRHEHDRRPSGAEEHAPAAKFLRPRQPITTSEIRAGAAADANKVVVATFARTVESMLIASPAATVTSAIRSHGPTLATAVAAMIFNRVIARAAGMQDWDWLISREACDAEAPASLAPWSQE